MDQSELDRYVREAFREMSDKTPHPAIEQLTALVRNELDGGRRAEVEGHLSSCPICRAQLEELREFLQECGRPPDSHVAPRWEELQGRVRRRKAAMLMRPWGSIA